MDYQRLKISIKHKNRLYKSQLLRPGIFSANAWRKLRQIITRSFLIVISIINVKAGSKSTFINKILIDGKVIKDQNNISDAMNNHFCTIGDVLKAELSALGHIYQEYLPERVMIFFFIEPICNDDVGLEIKHLNPKKAPGPDCIGGKLIQLCPDMFSNNLTKIHNRAIQTGVYPHDMKLAQVIALYKKGVRHDPNNYIVRSASYQSLTKYLKRFYVKDLYHS